MESKAVDNVKDLKQEHLWVSSSKPLTDQSVTIDQKNVSTWDHMRTMKGSKLNPATLYIVRHEKLFI